MIDTTKPGNQMQNQMQDWQDEQSEEEESQQEDTRREPGQPSKEMNDHIEGAASAKTKHARQTQELKALTQELEEKASGWSAMSPAEQHERHKEIRRTTQNRKARELLEVDTHDMEPNPQEIACLVRKVRIDGEVRF